MINKLVNILKNINNNVNAINSNNKTLSNKVDISSHLSAQILLRENLKLKNISNIKQIEYSVYSQFGQDGIIQYLINVLDINNKAFVEFGVEDYRESSTRFLLKNNNWSGLVLDGSSSNINAIKKQKIYWQNDLNAVEAFITKDNINDLILNNINVKDVELLIVDIDGNDYWIWEAITSIEPSIVFCEFNSTFGKDLQVTIPYKKDFVRSKEHYSNLYFGASFEALKSLGERKGYELLSANSHGNDLIFVKKNLISKLKNINIKNKYVKSKFRESRNKNNELTFIAEVSDRLEEIKDCKLLNLKDSKEYKIKELYE